MHSFIIIGKDIQIVKDKAQAIVDENKISKFDVSVLTQEKPIGIAQIREISKKIFLKPMQGDTKAIVIEAFPGMTVDSQNAFLKVLEEPPLSTIIIILAYEDFFLPTVLSRCTLIEVDKNLKISKEEEEDFLKVLEDLQNPSFDRLKLAQDVSKDKAQALLFLERLIIVARNKMVEDENREVYKRVIEVLNKYYKEIKISNVNLRLALENLFLEI